MDGPRPDGLCRTRFLKACLGTVLSSVDLVHCTDGGVVGTRGSQSIVVLALTLYICRTHYGAAPEWSAFPGCFCPRVNDQDKLVHLRPVALI